MKNALAIVVLVLGFSVAGRAADVVTGIVDPYFRIQSSLTVDKIDNVKADATAIAAEAEKIGEKGKSMATAAQQLAGATDLGKARDAFGKLSDALLEYADSTKASLGDSSRVAYCPMVRKSWVQKGDTIANPYLGKEMPGCGEIKKKPSH